MSKKGIMDYYLCLVIDWLLSFKALLLATIISVSPSFLRPLPHRLDLLTFSFFWGGGLVCLGFVHSALFFFLSVFSSH